MGGFPLVCGGETGNQLWRSVPPPPLPLAHPEPRALDRVAQNMLALWQILLIEQRPHALAFAL